MKKEYDISQLHPRKNPYIGQLKKQVTINLDNSTVDYFKQQSAKSGLPYQTLINLYLNDCVAKQRSLQLSWS